MENDQVFLEKNSSRLFGRALVYRLNDPDRSYFPGYTEIYRKEHMTVFRFVLPDTLPNLQDQSTRIHYLYPDYTQQVLCCT